jgi:uncharacterized protein (DUF302 family)
MKVFAVIDHSGEARQIGLECEHQARYLRQPRGRNSVMEAAPLSALDLPLRVIVWADGHQTKLSYTAPAALAARYGLNAEMRLGSAGSMR